MVEDLRLSLRTAFEGCLKRGELGYICCQIAFSIRGLFLYRTQLSAFYASDVRLYPQSPYCQLTVGSEKASFLHKNNFDFFETDTLACSSTTVVSEAPFWLLASHVPRELHREESWLCTSHGVSMLPTTSISSVNVNSTPSKQPILRLFRLDTYCPSISMDSIMVSRIMDGKFRRHVSKSFSSAVATISTRFLTNARLRWSSKVCEIDAEAGLLIALRGVGRPML